MLTLYHGVTSTCSKRVRMTLAEKGVEWESVHLDLSKRDNLNPEYLKINPNGVVPTIVHDGNVLYESNFIIEYLDDVFPEPALRPSDPYERARMRILMDRIEHVLHRNINTVSWIRQERYKRFDGMTPEQLQNVLDDQATEEKRAILKKRLEDGVSGGDMAFAEARVAEVLDELDAALQGRPWLCGENLSLADISIAPFMERFEANKMPALTDWVKRPRLGDWWERTKLLESFQKAFAFKPPEAA
ncbi:MAG: glutathione S-transferase family protein [Alphaproteobacteria bacterium]|jgi:glutathione S-transferase|nr:glutathione S-transferase family protein [Rhodospirillaceae bacterium]MBT6959823.1 glutathione S-transferase family protein [Rhodospirillaceae bacterium]